MRTNEKAKETFFTTPACTYINVFWSSHSTSFICWKHMHMQIQISAPLSTGGM